MGSSYNGIVDDVFSKIVDFIYKGILIVMIPMLIVSLSRFEILGWSSVFYASIVSVVLVVAGFLLRHRLSYQIRISMIVLCAVLIATSDFSALGMMSLGVISLMAATIIIALFFELKATILFFLGSLVYLFVMVYCAVRGVFEYDFSLHQYFYSVEAWYAQVITYVLVSIVLGFAIIRLKDNLNTYIIHLVSSNKELQEAHEETLAVEEELRSQYQTTISREEMIRYIAFHDSLTDLPNRTSFINKMRELITHVDNDHTFAVILMDLDDFKKTNDLLGHDFGDDVLIALSKVLVELLDQAIMVARLSGDEFGILMPAEDICLVKDSCRGILEALEEPLDIDSVKQYLKCSIGISVYPRDGKNYHELLQFADTAMTEVKHSGKHNYRFFGSLMKETITRKLEMENDLQLVYRSEEFFPVFQPKVNAITEEVVGFEALARWQSPKFGFVPPDVFIPLIEECGIMRDFGLIMLEKSLERLKEWHDMGHNHLTMAVNVSAVQFKDDDFVERVEDLLRRYQINPGFLEIEITESTFIDDLERVVGMLEALRHLGVKVSLDDFGTGFSSLTYLRKLPITTLKIDKSFVDAVEKDNDTVMIPSIINMAHGLAFDVVAEGIEEADQADVLKTYYCDYLQGYYFCKPISAGEITTKYFA